MTRVKRSCNADNIIDNDTPAWDEILMDSWDYWESRGLANPSKREQERVKPLKPLTRSKPQ